MTATPAPPAAPSNDAAIQRVLWRILTLNLMVASAKLIVGLSTGAIAMVADGFSSLIDGLSNLIAIFAQRLAAKPPDKDHPYGHRRFETLATFIIGAFLLLAAWEVLQAAIGRLLEGGQPEVTALSFGVLGATLVINLFVVWYERKRGRELDSVLLLADAKHTFTDVLVTISVIISLILVQFGLAWADAGVALIIVLVIARMGWKIISEAGDVLADAAPIEAGDLERVALAVPQVDSVAQVRSRGAGDDVRVDMEVQVASELSAEHTHNIGNAIQEAVQTQFPMVREVQVSFAPKTDARPDYLLWARAAADGLGLGVHEVIAVPLDDGLNLEMHVEVARGLSLAAAHEQVQQFEQKLLSHERISGVITHIEPRSGQGAPLAHSNAALALRDEALTIAQTLYPDAEWEAAQIRLALGGYALTLRCCLPGAISVEEAHQIAEQVETRIRADVELIQRVTIHTAPR